MIETVHSLADAPKASLNAFFRTFVRSNKADFSDADGVLRWRTPIAHPWFNGVLASRPPSSHESAIIQEHVAYFRRQGVDIFSWWLEPDLSVEDWASQLQPNGFKIIQDVPGMACDLKELPSAVSTPAGFSIQTVNDLERLKVWAEVFCRGFGLPGSFIQPFYELSAGLGFQNDLHNYLGTLDGEPVAASSLFLSDGIAGIYNVAVLEQARGKGLGAAITLAPLLEARDQGYGIGALQSSEMGFNVYRRLGFHKVCDVTHFLYVTSSS